MRANQEDPILPLESFDQVVCSLQFALRQDRVVHAVADGKAVTESACSEMKIRDGDLGNSKGEHACCSVG